MPEPINFIEPRGLLGRALFAYAAGDAFGVGYEFLKEPRTVDRLRLAPRSESSSEENEPWPLGGVSDDTLLTQISIASMSSGKKGAELGAEFLTRLHAAMPELRGLGPTTRKALGLSLRDDEVSNGRSNGAMMRTALIGASFTASQAEERRATVYHLAAATHSDSSAQYAALALSAVFSAAYENSNVIPDQVITVEHNSLLDSQYSVEEDWLQQILDYVPPALGTSLDPLDTLGAILYVTRHTHDVQENYYMSCELGGDTDTVGALAGGLGALRFRNDVLGDIPWFSEVNWSEVPHLQEFADILEGLRG